MVPGSAPFPCSFKQQNLEQRQSDVEYELRCLLNKPGKALLWVQLPPFCPWGFIPPLSCWVSGKERQIFRDASATSWL